MGFFYKIQKAVLRFIGDIKWHGVLHPFWFTINARGYELKGEHYRRLIEILEPGDIFLRRFEGYVDKWFIPGYWNHAGIYVGNNQVIHAVSEGVLKEDVLNFMRTDKMSVLRPPKEFVKPALKSAETIVGYPYDFGFDFKDCNRFSCTELVDYCYPGLVNPKASIRSLGKKVIVADDFFGANKVELIWDSRHPEVYGFSVQNEKEKAE